MGNNGLRWFRFYADWIDNPKVQLLDATLQQRYIMLLCLRCMGEVPGLDTETIAWRLRIDPEDLRKTLDILAANGLWDDSDIPNWNERQFVSDSSTERSRKHRAASPQRCCNGDATLQQRPQSQTQTSDTEKITHLPPKRVDGVAEVVEYLNQVTGKKYSLDKGNKEIEGALKRGATVQDCKDVIDHRWRLWGNKPDMVHNVNKSTPFRAIHFDTYLDEAQAGNAKMGRAASGYIEY